MADNQKIPSLATDNGIEIRWHSYNYPPLIRLLHFVPNELPKGKKFIVMSLFGIHIACLLNSLLNFIDNCIEGGIGILYSLLFMVIINPVILYVFYRGYTGICKNRKNLKMYIIVQPILIALEVTISIIDFLGFNGFVRASQMFKEGRGAAGALGLIVSVLYLAMGGFSLFIYIRILKERSILTESLE